tara:strand:- start:4263 stop:4439 length:177 start_codon:yes stop_codon:yes gene_type:complete
MTVNLTKTEALILKLSKHLNGTHTSLTDGLVDEIQRAAISIERKNPKNSQKNVDIKKK